MNKWLRTIVKLINRRKIFIEHNTYTQIIICTSITLGGTETLGSNLVFEKRQNLRELGADKRVDILVQKNSLTLCV